MKRITHTFNKGQRIILLLLPVFGLLTLGICFAEDSSQKEPANEIVEEVVSDPLVESDELKDDTGDEYIEKHLQKEPVPDDYDPLSGAKLLQNYAAQLVEVPEKGISWYEINEGFGKAPEYGSVVHFMIKAYDANGGELYLGDANHSHPPESAPEHTHNTISYNARWTYFGAGGGTVSLGIPKMEELFYDILANMNEMGTAIVYIPSEIAYGSEGYVGHEFEVKPDTDILLKITLLRINKVFLPEDVGFVEPDEDSDQTDRQEE